MAAVIFYAAVQLVGGQIPRQAFRQLLVFFVYADGFSLKAVFFKGKDGGVVPLGDQKRLVISHSAGRKHKLPLQFRKFADSSHQVELFPGSGGFQFPLGYLDILVLPTGIVGDFI